ncbi:hypothetical protein BGZ83_004970 [Gryganskiella cystojenkinii]|nr:hypothetical protein BGZ83_004970 [Gryganskiella cystojenkinii]
MSELDKSLGSESKDLHLSHLQHHHHSHPTSTVAAGQPRSQSSDPHLHQHFTQQQQRSQTSSSSSQQQQQLHQQLPPPPPQSSFSSSHSSRYRRGDHGSYSHPYLDSYSQQPHHRQSQQQQHHKHQQPQSPTEMTYQYDHLNRYYSSAGSLPDIHMSSAASSSGGSRSEPIAPRDLHQHNPLSTRSHDHLSSAATKSGSPASSTSAQHSQDNNLGLADGRSDSQQQHRQKSSGDSGNSNNNNNESGTKSGGESGPGEGGNSTSGNGNGNVKGAGSAGTEHGRNSSKRAAQNRAAQRAFRQRKDLYVRSLEVKAQELELAEGKISILLARNQELEAKFAAMFGSSAAAASALPPPYERQEDVEAASSLVRAAAAASSSGGPQPPLPLSHHHALPRDRDYDPDWEYDRPRERERDWGQDARPGHPSSAPVIGPGSSYDSYYHSSAAVGPSSTRPAIARHSSTQHLHHAYNASSPPLSNGSFKHLSLNSNKSSRYESDPDVDGSVHSAGQPQHPPRPHRHLHRHPSESSLNLGRTGTFPGFGSYRDEQQPAVPSLPRLHGDFRTDNSSLVTSPPSQSKSPMSGTFAQRSPGLYDSSTHHFPGSPLSPTHERMSLYGPRGGSGGSVSSPTSAHGESAYDLGKKRPSEGAVNWTGGPGGTGSDGYPPHHRPGPLSDGGSSHVYHPAVKKQSSWSSLSDRHRHHSVKKQPSWGSISEHRSHQYHATLRETAQYQRELSARAASSPGPGSHSASASPAMGSTSSVLSPSTATTLGAPILGFAPKQHGSMTPSASALTAAAEAARAASVAAAANAGVSLPPVASLSLSARRGDYAMTSAGEETDDYSEPLSPLQHQQQRFQPQQQHAYQPPQYQQQQQGNAHHSPQPYQPTQFQSQQAQEQERQQVPQQGLHHRASASSISSPRPDERRPSMSEAGLIDPST